jgi:hypothetical protein
MLKLSLKVEAEGTGLLKAVENSWAIVLPQEHMLAPDRPGILIVPASAS